MPRSRSRRCPQGWDAGEAGKRAERQWNDAPRAYQKRFPAAAEFERRMGKGDCRQAADASALSRSCAEGRDLATRKASQNVLESLVPRCRS